MKEGKEEYYHTTSLGRLKAMLSEADRSRRAVMSVKSLAGIDPDMPLSVETLPLMRVREDLPAKEALRKMRAFKDPDKVFLTRGGWLPSYGDAVVAKDLGGSVRKYHAFNSIPGEHTSFRRLYLTGKDRIYVPPGELEALRGEHPGYDFRDISDIEGLKYTWLDRAKAVPGNFAGRLLDLLGLGSLLEKTSEEKPPKNPVRRSYGRSAMLTGSTALGIGVDGASDVDVFVPYLRNRKAFERAVESFVGRNPGFVLSAPSVGRDDKKVFTKDVDGVPTDVALIFGDRARDFRDTFLKAKEYLEAHPEWRDAIKRNKTELKNAWILPEWRYRRYKKRVSDELGIKKA